MRQIGCLLILLAVCCESAIGQGPTTASDTPVARQLTKAGDNRPELQKALDDVRDDCREGMEFLIRHMPVRDLKSLTAKFLISNVEAAYDQWRTTQWHTKVPHEIFLNNVLPYANINERRDNWRLDFQKRFGSLVKNVESPGLAGAILNQKIFAQVGVRYSTRRRKADQAPFESIESGLASCTGLSVLLIDACRANGIPARFVGTPLWSDRSGNHSWVEIWDNGGWHFTGAAEASGNDLDKAWFVGRASKAQRDDKMHAIYAVSFKRTPISFPLVWDRRINDVYAVNVTDRYTQRKVEIPAGHVSVMFVARKKGDADRCAVSIKLTDSKGKQVFAGTTRDERFDANDHVTAIVPAGELQLNLKFGGNSVTRTIHAESNGQLIPIELEAGKTANGEE